ncbi:branched-chain amino acid ABC transporter permease [Diaphorobacter aerolatus]|uniref:Branched-chain amino acid ABC transporter permease n=1 Tax=Diaphorobacter aerolatus TaxID=1288495 RepID=A0A7H0GL18_9BURK|nr:branched-chain amino acid ABC transporter permease [Diaphorobacter aerolatus]QNP48984.1 branched-chain amino acid ABC transporter permease [Diaphorobacter aerolatus]
MKTSIRYFCLLLVLVVIAIPMGPYQTDVYRKLLIWVSMALSFNFLFGVAGQLAFSHFTFYGLGAYSVVILSYQAGLPVSVAAVLALVLCALIALAVAIPSTRLTGFYLALATLALAQLVTVLQHEGGSLTGGANGLANYPVPSVFGIRAEGLPFTAVIAVLLLGTVAALRALDRSYFGRACRAVRDDPNTAAAMGIDVVRTKVVAYMATSVMAAAAGMCYAFVDRNVNPAAFGVEYSFLLLFAVVVGGVGSMWGAIIGAVLVFALPLYLAPVIGHYHVLVFGVVVVLIVLLEPRGLIGLGQRLKHIGGRS